MFFVQCPHCSQSIEVLEINCKIFRCGVYKDSYKQIDPHMSKIGCDQLVAESKIYGCSKPFKLVSVQDSSANSWTAVECEYI